MQVNLKLTSIIFCIGVIASVCVMIRYIKEVQYKETVPHQLEKLFMPTINDTSISINGEKYIFVYKESYLLNPDAIILKKNKQYVFIEYTIYKNSIEPKNSLGTYNYTHCVTRDSLKAPLEMGNKGTVNSNLTTFINEIIGTWYKEWLGQYGEVKSYGVGSRYNANEIQYDEEGTLEGCVISRKTGKEQIYKNNWKAESADGEHIEIVVEID